MERDEVMAMLKAYRHNTGRVRHLAQAIADLDKQIAEALATMKEDAALAGGVEYDGMPRGNSVGRPTETIGTRLADGWVPEDILEMEREADALRVEMDDRRREIAYVSGWLEGLPERERWVVETQVIDGVFWTDVITRYRVRFGCECSKRTLARHRDKGMAMIYKMVG